MKLLIALHILNRKGENAMFYVPVLKWKAGEKDALVHLQPKIKENIRPLIELTPDIFEKGIPLNVSAHWQDLFYFDVSLESELLESDFVDLVASCDDVNQMIPVIHFDDSYSKMIALHRLSINGLALRVSIEDAISTNFSATLEEIATFIPLNQIDFILNVQEIDENDIQQKIFLVSSILNNTPILKEFKNIILTNGSFPASLSDCTIHEITLLERLEMKFYYNVVENVSLPIIFSDYPINHWSYFEFKPGIRPSFNIRYTTDTSYLIYKGFTIQNGGLNISNVVVGCNAITNHPLYLGPSYSWADNEIYLKATEQVIQPGNLTTWRTIGTNHHITLTVNQFANLPASSESL